MANILFTHSYFYRFDAKQWKAKQPYPPLATICAAALMRESGHSVSLFDTNLAEGPDGIIPIIEKEKPKYLVIYDDGFNYLTKMCLTKMREAAFLMAKMGKQHGCTVIVSSSDSTDHSEQYLDEGADFVLLGEADMTLHELVDCLESDKCGFGQVHGLTYKADIQVVVTPKRKILTALDKLPAPAWDLIDMKSYKDLWIRHQGYFSLNIATTRGCPFKCNWCAKPIYGNRYNTRSPKRVVDEIEHLVDQYGADHFWMCDDIFGLKPGWVQEFRNELKDRKLKIRFKIQSRVDLLLQEDTVAALADSGAETVWVGAESGSQKILDAMDKGTTVEQIQQATTLMQQKGIKVGFFLQFGYLGETEDDIIKTVNMVKQLMPDDIGISVSYPLPGTKFYDRVKDDLNAKANWSDSDDLALMFSNTYDPKYYKVLHRYVHRMYRSRQGFQSLRKLIASPFRAKSGEWRSIGAAFYHYALSLALGTYLRKLERAV